MTTLPFNLAKVNVPPLKCQGIKTKLVPFIFRSIAWQPTKDSRWIEPFVGSGAVAFNLAPQRAVLGDMNKHIIRVFEAIQSGILNPEDLREFLTVEGTHLAKYGADYYYDVRERFNEKESPFDFVFLNRSCFNGVIRFNRYGKFNVPFGHKPNRFSVAYITKIVNQVKWVRKQMRDKDWQFRVAHWQEILTEAKDDDFVYLDPPYIGRHTDYVANWDEAEAAKLAKVSKNLPCGFALSMWLENRHRRNLHIEAHWAGLEVRVCRHFYHVGSTENLRNEIDEALVIKPGYATPCEGKQFTKKLVATKPIALPLFS